MMLGLLAAYGSDESDSDSEKDEPDEKPKEKVSKLPNPFETATSTTTSSAEQINSVFVNQYVAAANAKEAILEKHVKMVSTDVKTVNGKKICWNYRMKKCRFGHKCKFAHDSDLQLQGPENSSISENQFKIVPSIETDEVEEESTERKGKKRPGLSQGIEPSKKVMNMYYSTKK